MLLEDQRYVQEDLERLEQGITDRMSHEPTFIRDRLNRDHEVAQLLEQIQKQSSELISMYEDVNGIRSKEIQAIGSGDPFDEFYKQVEEIKEHHAKYPTEQAENPELRYRPGRDGPDSAQPYMVDMIFSGEEAFGKFFDLLAAHEAYINLPNVKHRSYLQYLEVFDDFAPGAGGVKRADKLTDQYFKYVGDLAEYLESFMRRARPLENLDKLFASFVADFEKLWEKEEVPHWGPEKSETNGSAPHATSTAEAVWCDACEKEFKNENVYKNHLTGRKHVKAAEHKAKMIEENGGTSEEASTDGPNKGKKESATRLKERAVAEREYRVTRLTEAMKTERDETKINVERRQGMTERERQQELENLYNIMGSAITTYGAGGVNGHQGGEGDEDEGEDGEEKIYNPLKLPLAWDGKPIPFWLYRLHGLGVEFPCEICGNFVYMGRRAYEKHFNEARHIYGLKCLGISNTSLFRDIISIEEALKLWDKIQRDRKRNMGDDGSVVQMEDAEGNVMPEKVYYDLQKQGLLLPSCKPSYVPSYLVASFVRASIWAPNIAPMGLSFRYSATKQTAWLMVVQVLQTACLYGVPLYIRKPPPRHHSLDCQSVSHTPISKGQPGRRSLRHWNSVHIWGKLPTTPDKLGRPCPIGMNGGEGRVPHVRPRTNTISKWFHCPSLVSSLQTFVSRLVWRFPYDSSNTKGAHNPHNTAMDFYKEKATQLLLEHREAHTNPEFSPLACSCQCTKFPKDGTFTYKEINHVMARIVDENGSVDLVNALIRMGADVNVTRRSSTSLWKKVARRHQTPERSDLLQVATVRCRPELVEVLAAQADQANLDNALRYAILRRDLHVLQVLLDAGADPAELHDDFEKAVMLGETEPIALLLAGPKKPCIDCISGALTVAIKDGASKILELCMAAGADPNYLGGQALVAAVEAKRSDYLEILLSSRRGRLAMMGSLDAAVGVAHQHLCRQDDETFRELLEMCLLSGAAGERTERLFTSGLVNCVKKKNQRLLDLILQYTQPIDPYHTLAVLEAIKSYQTVILAQLLRLKPSEDCLVAAMSQGMRVADSEVMFEIIALLLSLGARGPAVSAAFVTCVGLLGDNFDLLHVELGRLLLEQGDADVNYDDGAALRIAISASLMGIICDIMDKRPNQATLGAALPVAMGMEPSQRLDVVEMLLKAGASGLVVDCALVDAVNGAPKDTPLVKLLLTRASVNHQGGEALVGAIHNQDFDIIELILAQRPDREAMSAAAKASFLLPKNERRETLRVLIPWFHNDHLNFCLKQAILSTKKDTDLVELLLVSGADPRCDGGACLKIAASSFDVALLELLAQKIGKDGRLFTEIFDHLISQDEEWLAHSHIDVVELILRFGASGIVLSRALIDALQAMFPVRPGGSPKSRSPRSPMSPCRHSTAPPEAILDLLLGHGASTNYESGKSVQLVARNGDRHLLRKLLDTKNCASLQTATAALYAAISAGHTEARLLELIDVFADASTVAPDFSSQGIYDGMLPPLYLCLEKYPRSTVVMNRIISAGCDLSQTVRITYAPTSNGEVQEQSSDYEAANVLIWALLQSSSKTSSAVIAQLAKQGTDVSFVTEKSKVTPLIVAAKTNRPELVDEFLRLGARATVQDSLGRSALFYAARMGSHESVVLLLDKKLPINDGSLHEASRNFHVDVMHKLIEAGHDPDYRSNKHSGHTALTIMASRGIIPADPERAEAAVDILKRFNANSLLKVHGRTAVFMALDNIVDSAGPEAITTLLLDRLLWKTLNDEKNVYTDQQGYSFSPTMYLKKGLSRAHESQQDVLLSLLRGQGAIDRFYASIDAEQQPVDAVGMPDEIREQEKERRARRLRQQREDDDHARRLRMEEETTMHELRLSGARRFAEYDHTDRLADQHRRNRGLDHALDMQIELDKHINASTIRKGEADTTAAIEWNQHMDGEEMRRQKTESDFEYRIRGRSIQTLEERAELEIQGARYALEADKQARELALKQWNSSRGHEISLQKAREEAELNVWQRNALAAGETRDMRERDAVQSARDGRAMMDRWAQHNMQVVEKAGPGSAGGWVPPSAAVDMVASWTGVGRNGRSAEPRSPGPMPSSGGGGGGDGHLPPSARGYQAPRVSSVRVSEGPVRRAIAG
ncbi:hypothetical protein PspLS_02470 [Pyricularia sp. CBS 133598]|nr:hypothetical protein PspLS_02470 [Pyricularia sp. CBS 133598]